MIYNAVLVFPKLDYWNIAQYPTGLYKMASYCKEYYNILILDERLDENIEEIILEVLENHKILCVGFSVMTGSQIKHALTLSKKFHLKTKIIWGGMHPTLSPESVIENKYIDYAIIGDGEKALKNILDYLSKKDISEELFLSKKNKNFKRNIFKEFSSQKKYICFDKFKIKEEYFIKRDGFNKSFSLETSRGCPFGCSFCHNSILNKYHTLDENIIIKTIEYLHKAYGVDGIVFQEDNFFLEKNRMEKILLYLKNTGLKWKANCRIDYVEKIIQNGLMNLIVESNCKVMQFGIESGSDRILKLLNKKIDVKKILLINKLLAKFKIRIRYNFIIGFPTETTEEINETLLLIKQLRKENKYVESPFVNIYTPYPGTKMFKLAIENGFKVPNSLEEWANFEWNQVQIPWLDEKQKNRLENISLYYKNKTEYLKGSDDETT